MSASRNLGTSETNNAHLAGPNAGELSTHELMELANLDTMGLLDETEREQFERGFQAATPGVQAQIRREQLRLSSDDSMLPQVEPPLGLRARVLNALREVMGQGKTDAARKAAGVAGTIGMGNRSTAVVPGLRRAQGVNPIWRASAIGAIAASLVFGVVAFQVFNESQKLTSSLADNATNDYLLREYGARFDKTFFDPNTKLVSFSPTDSKFAGRATILLDPVHKKAQLFCRDLPVGDGEYEVVVVDAQGNATKAVLTFKPGSSGINQHLISSVSMETSQSIAIRKVGETQLMLCSR